MPAETSSAAPASVVVPTEAGKPQPGAAVAATPMKGGMALSPLPIGGQTGARRRGTKRLSKKALKMMKKMTPKQLKKLMKGGEEVAAPAAGVASTPGSSGSSGSSGNGEDGGRRRRSRKTKRRSGLLY